jgi:hypothetical protein
MGIHEEVTKLLERRERLYRSRDQTGVRKVEKDLERVRSGCNHRRTITQAAPKDSIDGRILKGALITWCKDCQKLLKP